MKSKILGVYQNGNYTVTILNDGTKIRENDLDNLTPAFAENCDVKFTHKCSQNCPFCYEGCTKDGVHSDILSQSWIYKMHPFTELAINGNDLDHPDLEKFLEIMHEQKVIVNITVNQNQFMNNWNKLANWESSGYVHGVGVSLINYNNQLEESIKSFPNSKNIVIHTINGILTEDEVMLMRNKGLKILILGYKSVRRGKTYEDGVNKDKVIKNKQYLYNNMKNMFKWFDVISYDNLAIEQLEINRFLTKEQWDEFYMGDDGQYTYYIDAVAKTFAKNSVISEKENFPINDMNVDEMFQFIQNKYNNK